jgi:serine/threonine protein kinase
MLIKYNQIEKSKLETDIMFDSDHPFLVGMHYVFQNELRLYFVMPFVKGGELYKIYKHK